MSAGFISPTFRVLEMNWEHDYEMVKLGVPTLMGHLYRLGHRDLSHWDFDAQICDACAEDPTAFDLRQYFDQGLNVVLNTDNRLMSGTNLVDEYQHAAGSLGFDFDELSTMALNGFASAFLPERERDALVARARSEIEALRHG